MTTPCSSLSAVLHRPRGGFTLIEALVATTLTLVLMGAVVQMFGSLGNSIADSRSSLEMVDRLRNAAMRLQSDLAGATAEMLPPQRSESAAGYFEIIEGPVGIPVNANSGLIPPQNIALNNDQGGIPDTTVGDFDDILMFTTHSSSQPFEGRCQWGQNGILKSDVAEVAWFVRGNKLFRRVLLVAPGALPVAGVPPTGFYENNDISVRAQNGAFVANSLADLAKRENRYAHDVSTRPFESRHWGLYGLPTLSECAFGSWPPAGPQAGSSSTIDFWRQPFAWGGLNPETGSVANKESTTRVAEDVILTHVIGFDVKVWDSRAMAYVDLGWAGETFNPPPATNTSDFSHLGDPRSGMNAKPQYKARVYDTWSTHYEAYYGSGTNGLDDNSDGTVDDATADNATETKTAPPYSAALRGIQVKIRCFEPDSRQIREITIVQDFLPK